MAGSQRAILDPVPLVARAFVFELVPGARAENVLAQLASGPCPAHGVVGLGLPLVLALGKSVPGLRAFPEVVGPGVAFPATQGALWAYLGGANESELYDRAAELRATLGDAFELREDVRCFRYREGRDLSGYVDGTANPIGDAAIDAAIVGGRGAGLDGSSFVSAQRWVHTLSRLAKLAPPERDRLIGRRASDNEEMSDAPPSAHVKRTEQEAFDDPPGFVVRRSMPWSTAEQEGLYFVAYGESLDRFERSLRRMSGADDGIVDGLLAFTRPVTGGHYWCPPVLGGKLDLSVVLG